MAPTPRDDSSLRETWIHARDRRWTENANLSLEQICVEIANEFACHPKTVRRYLDPAYFARQRRSSRESQRRRYTRLKRSKVRHREYTRLSRHPERYLPEILHGLEHHTSLPLDDITQRVRDHFNVGKFRPKTIERILRQYQSAQREGRIRGPPYLEETCPGCWYYGPHPSGG